MLEYWSNGTVTHVKFSTHYSIIPVFQSFLRFFGDLRSNSYIGKNF
jgi:hypothetical protein